MRSKTFNIVVCAHQRGTQLIRVGAFSKSGDEDTEEAFSHAMDSGAWSIDKYVLLPFKRSSGL